MTNELVLCCGPCDYIVIIHQVTKLFFVHFTIGEQDLVAFDSFYHRGHIIKLVS